MTETNSGRTMENQPNRRNFIKKAGAFALLSQVAFPGWARGFSTLLSEGINPAGEFSLLKLEKILPGYQLPLIRNFTTNSFESKFALYNLYGNNVTDAGDFRLNCVVDGENLQFGFTSARFANNGIHDKNTVFKYLVSGVVLCANNVALTPQKWNVSSKIALSEEGEAYKGTGIQNIGEVKGDKIHLSLGEKEIRKAFNSKGLSWKWGLIGVAQKMAELSVNDMQFALLDEFDAVYANQIMKFRRKVTLDCGISGLIDFKLFELTGEGVIPTVYWVDNMNRTVFVISGMEAYVLK